MKKFLSLVLALVMTMSLVTISAGATEYKDFTDKDEIQYAEAVTVLNKLGIITGYSEGDFRPEGELTRGAAAKILVSLLIGPDAAAALGNESSPYPDVPAGNNFAGVISYCKTAKIISGYGDGTFRPQGTLTGYAFAKMLLGALGYKSEYEGFTGAGWNMNVARLGGEVGLFDRISFNGNATVTREQACQLALNTLKGTMVEYKGGMNISTGDTTMVVKPEREYKISNQEFASHINNRKVTESSNATNDYYTVEFGEEHFVDLRMSKRETTAADQFGRPSNEWSWKKVTIGTFPIEADYIFDKQLEHKDATDGAKNRATGLGGFVLEQKNSTGTRTDATKVWVNGRLYSNGTALPRFDKTTGKLVPSNTSSSTSNEMTIENIADLTDNGTIVEVYVSDRVADFITDIVVVQTQLMEVRRVGSDYVALQGYDNGNSDDYEKAPFSGYNQNALNVRVENVQAEDNCYATLSGLKAGDIVAIIPCSTDNAGTAYEVADAYVPETVSGAITGVRDYGKTNSDRHAIEVTVGGTAYSVSVWNKKLHDITADIIKATKKDVTLYLDRNGNAMLAKDIGATNDWMVVGNFRQALENGKIINIVNGWDISGTAVELNVGTVDYYSRGVRPGDLVKYSSTTSNTAEWRIDGTATGDVYNVYTGIDAQTSEGYQIKASNTRIALETAGNTVTVDKGIKFIYVNFDEDDNEVESIEIKNGVQNVSNDELKAVYAKAASGDTAWNPAQGCIKDNAVKAVVIKNESNDAIATNMLYVRDYYGSSSYDSTGKMVYGYTVAMNTASDFVRETVVYSYDRLTRGDFASYTAVENADHSEFYSLRRHNNFVGRTTSTYGARFDKIVDANKGFVELDTTRYGWVNGPDSNANKPVDVGVGPATAPGVVQVSTDKRSQLGIGSEANIIDVKNANFVDLRPESDKKAPGREIDSYDDLKAVMMYGSAVLDKIDVVMIVNDDATKDGFRTVSMVVILASNKQVVNTEAVNTLDSMAFRTLDLTVPTPGGSATAVTVKAETGTTITGRLNWTFTGKSCVVTLNGNDVKNGEMVTLNGGANNVRAIVTSENNAQSGNYDFTITVNPASAGEDRFNAKIPEAEQTVAGATALKFLADKSNISINYSSNNALTFPGLKDGKTNSVKEQIEDALDFLGYTEFDVTNVGGDNWTAIGTSPEGVKERINCNAASGIDWYVKITVDGTPKYVKDETKLGSADPTDLQLTGNVKKVTKDASDNDVVAVVLNAVLNATEVEHGAAYTKDAFVQLLTVPTASNGFTSSWDTTAAGKVTGSDSNDYVEVGKTVVLKLTASDITLDGNTSKRSITLSEAADSPISFTNTDAVDGTPTTKVLTFKNDAGTPKLTADDVATATYTVKASHAANGFGHGMTVTVTDGT